MLEHLHIRNLALIEDMTLEFSKGINVLTGETGAGKSFILKALGFVLGDKLTADIVRSGAEKAQVEALFILDDKELVLRRELWAESGRSRFFINDVLSSQEALRTLRSQLIIHTSQHAQAQLLQLPFQAHLLEMYFPEPQLLIRRDQTLASLKQVDAQIEDLLNRQKDLAEKRELLEMQNAEIEKVDPKPGEEDELESLRLKIRTKESEKKNYAKAMAFLHGDESPGLIQLLTDFGRHLQLMSRDDAHLSSSIESVEIFRQELVELSNLFRRPPPSETKIDMDAIEERLFTFAQLKRKLKRSMPEILALQEDIKNNLSFLDACALDIANLEKKKAKICGELKGIIAEILPLRRQAAEKFAVQLEDQLKELGFSEHVKVVPDFVPQEIWQGIKEEKGRINWAPNPGQPPLPLDKIASGGELSRFLLGLTILGQQNKDLTYIFDEVDAGVGGLTLNKVAEKLQTLSGAHQIILITHWPQLASKAKTHFQITKNVINNNTFTQCKPLSSRERAREIERMAGGAREGKAMLQNLLE